MFQIEKKNLGIEKGFLSELCSCEGQKPSLPYAGLHSSMCFSNIAQDMAAMFSSPTYVKSLWKEVFIHNLQ